MTAAPVVPVADFTATPLTGQAPLTVVFENLTYGNADSYFWDFGDGNSSTEENPTHDYLSPGAYTVTLEAIVAGGETWEIKENFVVVTQ